MSVWTPNLVDKLRSLWAAGELSARQVANQLSLTAAYPITKNAVIGKIDRLGIGRPEDAHRRMVKENKRRAYKPRRSPAGQFLRLVWSAPEPYNGIGLPFRALEEGHCRYVLSEPRGMETLFCGAPKVGTAYCGAHHQICHQAWARRA